MDAVTVKTPTKRALEPGTSSSPNSSPKFMKPSDVFKRRMARKCNNGAQKFSPSKATAATRRGKLSIEDLEKVYSPLKCLQPSKRAAVDGLTSPRTKTRLTFSPLMKKLHRSPRQNGSIMFPVVKRSLASTKSHRAPPPIGRVLHFNEDAQWPSTSVPVTTAGPVDFSDAAKIDWSLKCRLRVVTNRPLPFHGTFSSVDEASGLNRFVRGDGGDTESAAESTFCAELQRHCLVWQHPHLPWMRLFPREPQLRPGSSLAGDGGGGRGPPLFTISPNGALADSLHSDFCGALHSLFKLVKSKYCPYFYLCANNFVALFRASGLAGSDEAHAMVVPTTAGFRALLAEENIQFEMPLHGNASRQASPTVASDSKISESSSGIEPDLSTDDEEEEAGNGSHLRDQADTEEESNQWLESLGLSQQDFPSLKTNAFRRRGRGSTNIDDQTARGKAKSLVRVQGIHQLQSLLAVFINHPKTCVASSGPLAGIPPTLLAPVAFHNATLTPLTIRHKSTTGEGARHLSTVDVSGPVLPHTVFGLVRLFQRLTGQPSSVVRGTLKTYDLTGSLALQSDGQKADENPAGVFSVENLQESGMDRDLLRAICSRQLQSASPLTDFELCHNGIRYNRFANDGLRSGTKSVFGSTLQTS